MVQGGCRTWRDEIGNIPRSVTPLRFTNELLVTPSQRNSNINNYSAKGDQLGISYQSKPETVWSIQQARRIQVQRIIHRSKLPTESPSETRRWTMGRVSRRRRGILWRICEGHHQWWHTRIWRRIWPRIVWQLCQYGNCHQPTWQTDPSLQ